MDVARSATRGGSVLRKFGRLLPWGSQRGGSRHASSGRRETLETSGGARTGLQKLVASTPSFRTRVRPEDEFQYSGDSNVKFGFPYSNAYWEEEFGCSAEKVVELLEPFMIEERASKFSKIIENRIFDIVPVVEGLFDLGNVAAVCRTVEGLGIGSLHVITGDGTYKQSARTTQGSHKWLRTQYWESTTECLTAAKENGYSIVVTDLEAAVSLDEIDWTQKTLLLFGNELAGVSEEAKKLADKRVIIPMHGFVESFNISVAAAMALKHACDAREGATGKRGDLTPEQQKVLRSVYYAKHVGSRSNDILHDLLGRERKALRGKTA
ncbi:SpoU-type tRNA/rRNA methyltransferase [Chloropicon primus]|nr:SpoU-type tRNA/rRNA methyltransferase [Chloropicon primus]